MNSRSKILSLIIVSFILAALSLGACAGQAPKEMSESVYAPEPAEYYDEEVSTEDEARFLSGKSTLARYDDAQEGERLVIKDADLSIVVSDPSSSLDEIAKLADDMGGFVVTANLFHTETSDGVRVPEGMITIRVPAERLNEALAEIKAQSDRDPISESISSQDVTQDYVDLQSRLRNLEAAEEKLIQIMEEARKTEDVLSVYNELVRVQEEIELIKGRMKYLEQSAALSSISTHLLADEAVQPLTIGGWEPVGVAKSAVQALINALKFLVNAGLWVLIFVLPIVLILFVVIFLPIRWLVRRVRKPKTEHDSNDSPRAEAVKQED
ncbi:MAG: DUF4349 domain-containing protein [Chloroflexota bacterium]|nr:DUF4349 domain-containing protein [Chloroflexota bacterium]